MNSLASRLLISTVVVALTYGMLLAVRAVGMPDVVRAPNRDIQDLPLQLGPWKGQDVALDPRVFRAISAEAALERAYSDDRGHTIALHIGVFPLDKIAMPHPPRACYELNGYQIGEQQDLRLTVPDGPAFSAQLLTMTRDQSPAQALYWYQLGEQTFVGREELRRAFWSYRGEPAVPPVVKVLLHDGSPSADDSTRLREFAELVYHYTHDL